jgi:hypothetical protein
MVFLGAVAQAQSLDTGVSRSNRFMGMGTSTSQKGWAGYLTANAGYTGYNRNVDAEGMPSSLKLLGSYVSQESPGVIDLGYGVQNQSFSQKAAADSGISTGVMEIAGRYQFDNRWQLGVVYNQFFNRGSSYGAKQADVAFGGIQTLREFGIGERYIGRLGGRIMTSINVNNEAVNMAMLDFQMGWGGEARSRNTTSN